MLLENVVAVEDMRTLYAGDRLNLAALAAVSDVVFKTFRFHVLAFAIRALLAYI